MKYMAVDNEDHRNAPSIKAGDKVFDTREGKTYEVRDVVGKSMTLHLITVDSGDDYLVGFNGKSTIEDHESLKLEESIDGNV